MWKKQKSEKVKYEMARHTKLCWECKLVLKNTKQKWLEKNQENSSFNNGSKITEDDDDDNDDTKKVLQPLYSIIIYQKYYTYVVRRQAPNNYHYSKII